MGSTQVSVAIQGERGSFSHQAAVEVLGEELMLRPQPSFEALFAAVSGGEAERGLVPIENSLAGSIHENYDRLRAGALHIVGETQLRIRHCLLARPGATLGSIRRVASHPVALAQCRDFFAARPHIEAVAAYDTAGSVRDLLRPDGVATQGAIASHLAARIYGAQVLMEGIEDDPQNYTRFLMLAREPQPIEGVSKTSLVFSTANVPGALHGALGAFATRGVDLSKIESRPLRGRPWEYSFYLDAVGDPRGALGEALAELETMASDLRVLGTYPNGTSGRGDDEV
jgi:prephenate dehydratase